MNLMLFRMQFFSINFFLLFYSVYFIPSEPRRDTSRLQQSPAESTTREIFCITNWLCKSWERKNYSSSAARSSGVEKWVSRSSKKIELNSAENLHCYERATHSRWMNHSTWVLCAKVCEIKNVLMHSALGKEPATLAFSSFNPFHFHFQISA